MRILEEAHGVLDQMWHQGAEVFLITCVKANGEPDQTPVPLRNYVRLGIEAVWADFKGTS